MSKIDNSYNHLLKSILKDSYKYPDPNRRGIERLEIPSYTFRHEFKDGFPIISTRNINYNNITTELIWFLKGDTNIKYLVDNGCNIWNKDAYNHYLKTKDFIGGNPMTIEEFVKRIKDNKLTISTSYYKLGDLGPVYGKQWRDFGGIDQIKDLIQGLKEKPLGTEHIVTAWNPGEKHLMALPACHYGFQILVRPLSILERIYFNGDFSKDDYDNKWNEFFEKNKRHAEDNDKLKFLEEIGSPLYGFELHWNQRSVDTFLG